MPFYELGHFKVLPNSRRCSFLNMVGTGEIKRSESVSAQFYSFMLLFEHGKLNFLERNFEGLATTIGKANLKSFDLNWKDIGVLGQNSNDLCFCFLPQQFKNLKSFNYKI